MLDTRAQNLCRFGAFCCFAAGVLFASISLLAFLLPPSIAKYQATEAYFPDFTEYKWLFILLKILLFCANLAMIGVVSAFAALVRDKNAGIVLWASIIAIIGYGIGLYQSILDITVIPHLVEQYMQGGPAIRQAIKTFGFSNPAVYILSMGLPGIWFITVSVLALDNIAIPKGLLALGFLWGVGGIMTAIAHTIVILPFIYLVAVGAVVFAPLWSFWEGMFLYRLSTGSRTYEDEDKS